MQKVLNWAIVFFIITFTLGVVQATAFNSLPDNIKDAISRISKNPYCYESKEGIKCGGKKIEEYNTPTLRIYLTANVKKNQKNISGKVLIGIGKFLLETAAGEVASQAGKWAKGEIEKYESPSNDMPPCTSCGCKGCIPGYGINK